MIDAYTIQQRVRAAGIVGAGGAGFPTHVKMAAKAEIYLVNGAECEPLLKVDQQLAEKYAAQLVRGLELGMIATGATEGVIALKAKYGAAIEVLTPLLRPNMRIHILKDVYPAGDEVITIWMATGRRVPPAALPLSVGVVVSNVQTLINVANAVDHEQPVTQRTLTITGAVHHPITVTVPLGVTIQEVVDMAGGTTVANAAFINGGPMMGKLIESLSETVTKTTGGIIALPADHILIKRHKEPKQVSLRIAKTTCEQCCLCTELCPRHIIGHELPPHLIVRAVNYSDVAKPSVLLSALTCSECAICEAWSCPVDISPMKLNQMLKKQFREEGGAKYVGELRDLDPMAEHRLVPISRLIQRLDIQKYNVKAPLFEEPYHPARVQLNLRQHIGQIATPRVAVGDRVVVGQCVADVDQGQLGAPIHASINGVVSQIQNNMIEISAH